MTTQETTLLVRWQRDQDAEAFATLVSRYSGLVYGTCRRMLGDPHDAQDATQQCFMRLAYADATSISYLGGWLHCVAANLCRDHVKREVRRRLHERAYADTVPDAAESPCAGWPRAKHEPGNEVHGTNDKHERTPVQSCLS
jgi:RNA polymerase sigma factor (sigma-70 family)